MERNRARGDYPDGGISRFVAAGRRPEASNPGASLHWPASPYISAGGDSGGAAFTYPNGSDTLAAGVVIGATAAPGTTSSPCLKSTSYDCAFFYMPIGRVKDLEPYQIRTTAGYVSPT